VRPDSLFDLYGKQVPIQHARRAQKTFTHTLNGDDCGKATRLPYATLDFFDALREVRMAGLEVRPRRQDSNDWFVLKVFGRKSCLLDPATLVSAYGTDGREPPLAPKFIQCLSFIRQVCLPIPLRTHAVDEFRIEIFAQPVLTAFSAETTLVDTAKGRFRNRHCCGVDTDCSSL